MFRQNRRIGGGTSACIVPFNSCKHTSNLRNILVSAVILSLFFDSTIVFSAPRSKFRSARARRNFARSAEAKTTQNQSVITAENPTAKAETVSQSATLLNENIGTEQVASQTTETSENDAEVREKIANLQQKISDVKSECSGIKKDLDTIFGFTTATTVASGLGTVSAGGALVAGIKKSKTDKSAEEIERQLSQKKERLDYITRETLGFHSLHDEEYIEVLENGVKENQVMADGRKSKCSALMQVVRDKIKQVKENHFKYKELYKKTTECWDEANAIDGVKKLNEEIEFLMIDRNSLCGKYYNKEQKECIERQKKNNDVSHYIELVDDCTPYIQSKNCYVKGSYKDLEEIDEKIRVLHTKVDKNTEYYSKSKECKKFSDETDIANEKMKPSHMYNSIYDFYWDCDYGIARRSGAFVFYPDRFYAESSDDRYIPYLEKLEKEYSMDFESFDKKYYAEYSGSYLQYTDEKLKKDNEEIEKKLKIKKKEKEERIALWKEKPILRKEISELEKELEVLNVNSESTGNLRTGLMAGATVTSAVSTGTSIGATVNADKLAKKMSDCNQKLYELKIAKSELEALESFDKSAVEAGKNAFKILGACTGFNKNNINTVKNKMTASAIISGIGTATGATGTITSAMANSKKVREDDSEKGKKKEKNLNLTANIMAGITTGTSLSTTVISATAIADAKKDSKMAEECEAVLK